MKAAGSIFYQRTPRDVSITESTVSEFIKLSVSRFKYSLNLSEPKLLIKVLSKAGKQSF